MEHIDEDGTVWRVFLASYEVNGSVFGFSFVAKDMADAEEHILAMMDTVELDGRLIETQGLH